MPSQFIGVVRGTVSGNIYAVINPSEDDELDKPCWLQLRAQPESGEEAEPVSMLKIPRGDHKAMLSPDDVAAIIEKLK